MFHKIIREKVEVIGMQFVFRLGKEITNATFVARQVQQK